MGKYFGTDGVRGVAGADLTCELAMKIGRGAAAVLTGSTGHRPRILIGKVCDRSRGQAVSPPYTSTGYFENAGQYHASGVSNTSLTPLKSTRRIHESVRRIMLSGL